MIRYSYDGGAQAAYILVATNAVANTEQIESSAYLDVSEDGQPVGIELLNLPVGSPPRLSDGGLDTLEARGVPVEVLQFLGRGTSSVETAQARFLTPA